VPLPSKVVRIRVRWLQGTSRTTRPTHEAKLPVVQSALAPNSTNGLVNLIRVCVLDRFQQLPHLLGRHFSLGSQTGWCVPFLPKIEVHVSKVNEAV
jgi:hypothetical protein